MDTTSNEVLGIVLPDGSLKLTGKLTVPPGRVRVHVESLEPQGQPAEGLVEFVQRLRRELEVAGHEFRTKEEIDAELQELRGEWDERLEGVSALPEQLPEKG